jgi:hypothetical protein
LLAVEGFVQKIIHPAAIASMVARLAIHHRQEDDIDLVLALLRPALPGLGIVY